MEYYILLVVTAQELVFLNFSILQKRGVYYFCDRRVCMMKSDRQCLRQIILSVIQIDTLRRVSVKKSFDIVKNTSKSLSRGSLQLITTDCLEHRRYTYSF